ncbi:MAG: FAD-binding oxidoreductase [Anaerolineales bacterium]
MTIQTSPTTQRFETSELDQLRARVSGQVLTAQDDGYDTARQAWNLTVNQYPEVIVVAATAKDVAEAVCFADEQNLDIAVKGGAHGTIREANGSMLIVTSQMTDVIVNAAAQTAWVSAGAKWGRVLEQAQAVGLAPLLGSSPDVGVVGYTLGGGMGWLARNYGLSTDSVNRFELITANGEMLNVSATENADLFWGLRGGGGNFGVVTGMEIRLYPVTTVYGGNLFYPIHKAKEVYAHYRRWIANAPDELTSSVVLMNFPPVPALPDFLRGQSFVIVRGCYSGPVEQGEELLKHWRTWEAPIVDGFTAMPFSQVAAISNDPVDPMPAHSSGMWLNDISDETVDVLIRYTAPRNGPPMLAFAEVRHAGGAIARVDPASAAYGNRDAQHILQVIGGAPTPEVHEALKQHIAQMKRALTPHLHGGVYMNFLEGSEAREATRSGFSQENYQRLQALKAKYDPKNWFSHSYDIAPR